MKLSLLIFLGLSVISSALEFKDTKVVAWKKGTSIGGDDFLAATETVADYLDALPHPTGGFETISYVCAVKSRSVFPTVINQPIGGGPTLYTLVRMVYDIKDCKKAESY